MSRPSGLFILIFIAILLLVAVHPPVYSEKVIPDAVPFPIQTVKTQESLPAPVYEPLELKTYQAPPQPVQAPQPVTGDVWYRLRLCESGNDYTKNTGNGFYGAYQFTISTWNSMGTGYSRADLAPPPVQDDAARRLQARSGWGQWPHCSSQLGLR